MRIGKKEKRFNLSNHEKNLLLNLLEYKNLSVGSKNDPIPFWKNKLEAEIKKKFGINYVITTNTGTTSIHSVLSSLNLNQGSEIIISPLTCYSSILPIFQNSLVPRFCDVEEDTYTINPKNILKNLSSNTKAVLLPYVYGLPTNIKKIKSICKNNELILIEDCAHVPGMKIDNKLVGTQGDVGCFSFAQGKILDCGEGGAAITNNEELYKKMNYFKEGGRQAFRVYYPKGLNLRIPEYNSFLALKSLNNLKFNLEKRKSIANLFKRNYSSKIKNLHNKQKVYPVQIFRSKMATDISNALIKEGFNLKTIYKPLNLSNVFNDKDFLLMALGNKVFYKQFLNFNNPTPIAKKLFEESFYFDIDVLNSFEYYVDQKIRFEEVIKSF